MIAWAQDYRKYTVPTGVNGNFISKVFCQNFVVPHRHILHYMVLKQCSSFQPNAFTHPRKAPFRSIHLSTLWLFSDRLQCPHKFLRIVFQKRTCRTICPSIPVGIRHFNFAKLSSNRQIQLNLNWVSLIFSNVQPPGLTSSEIDGPVKWILVWKQIWT